MPQVNNTRVINEGLVLVYDILAEKKFEKKQCKLIYDIIA